jgi:hypothetical protein
VAPRFDQAKVFVKGRLIAVLQQSPVIRRLLLGKNAKTPPLGHMQFRNGSQLYVRAAYHSGDAARGISADIVMVDEVQDVAGGDLSVIMETLSHSKLGRTILTGTPKSQDNHAEGAFSRSTANEWNVTSSICDGISLPDEHCLGPRSIICRHCKNPLDLATGRWVQRNPGATWGDGYWLNHCMVPWLSYDELLERQSSYDLGQFNNEVMGLPTMLGENIVTRAELELCCSDTPMAESIGDISEEGHGSLIAGIDWGGGGKSRTVVVIGWMRRDFVFEIRALRRFRPDEDTDQLLDSVAQMIRKFRVRCVAADGGGSGHHLNRLLLDRLKHGAMYAILYSNNTQETRQEGTLWKWTVNRSASIGNVFSRVKKRTIIFPRGAESGSFLDELACEVAVYDTDNRTLRYTHPETMQDDALHATNYALLLGVRNYHIQTGQITHW